MSAKAALGAGASVLTIAAAVVVYRSLQAPERAVRQEVVASAAEPATARSEIELERMRAELGLVQGQLRALREQVTERKAPEAPAPVEAQEPPDEASIQEQREESARRWKEHMADVSAAFESEPLDRRFASAAQAALATAIEKNPVVQAAVGNVDCRSRTCRVEVSDDRSGKLDKQLPLFVQSVGGTLPYMQAERVGDRRGPSKMVLYLTNERQPVAANVK